MALSNTPKDTLSTYQVLLDIAQALKDLTQNPDAIPALVKQVHALSDVEQRKLNEARANIAFYESLRGEQEEIKARLEQEADALSLGRQQLSDAVKAHDARLLALEAKDAALKEKDTALYQKERALAARETHLQSAEAELATARAALEAKAHEVAAYDASLKEKAAALQKLTQGL